MRIFIIALPSRLLEPILDRALLTRVRMRREQWSVRKFRRALRKAVAYVITDRGIRWIDLKSDFQPIPSECPISPKILKGDCFVLPMGTTELTEATVFAVWRVTRDFAGMFKK